LLISTGNITNRELEALIARNESAILTELAASAFIELDRTTLTVRG
jgi:predicted nuclease of predicted toxin-antitoxin system